MSDQRLLRIVCPNCQVTLKVAARRIGEAHRCPSCRFRILIPDPDQLEEAQPLSLSSSPQAGSIAATDPPPPPVGDDELLAHLHRRRSSLKRDGVRRPAGLARVAVTIRNRVERIQLTRQVRALRDSLRPRFIDLGSQAILEGDVDLNADDSRARLRDIVARLGECEDRLNLLGGPKGAGLLARDLRRQMAELEDDRDRVLEEIGRAAHRKRRGEPFDLRNIDVLQDMLNEHQVRLEELGGTPDGDPPGSPTRTRSMARRVLPISIVLIVVVSLLAWMGYRYVMSTLLEPLTESRQDIQPSGEPALVERPVSAGPETPRPAEAGTPANRERVPAPWRSF